MLTSSQAVVWSRAIPEVDSSALQGKQREMSSEGGLMSLQCLVVVVEDSARLAAGGGAPVYV